MYQQVLVPIDGSERAMSAVAHVPHVVGSGTSVTLLSVLPDRETLEREQLGAGYEFTLAGEGSPAEIADSVGFARRQELETALARARAELALAGVSAGVELREGEPGEQIVARMHELGVDAVVMASRGHGAGDRRLVGSVAEHVLRHAGGAAVVLVGEPVAVEKARPGSTRGVAGRAGRRTAGAAG